MGRRSVERGHSRYRTLSTVAANVAAAAALAAQKEEEDQPMTSSRSLQPYPTYGSHDDIHPGLASATHGGDDVDDDALAAMGDSMYSEGGRSAGGKQRKRMAWSVERSGRAKSLGRYGKATTPTVTQLFTSPELPPREPQILQLPDAEEQPGTSTRRNSRTSKRASTMVFLSVWALFGIGTLTNRGVQTRSSTSLGKLLYPSSSLVSSPIPQVPQALSSPVMNTLHIFPKSLDDGHTSSKNPEQDLPPPPPPGHEDPDLDRIIGRIFAWLCTTLYLTSRLPQIWKNVSTPCSGIPARLTYIIKFVRKSVEVSSVRSKPKDMLILAHAGAFDVPVRLRLSWKHILRRIYSPFAKNSPSSTSKHRVHQRIYPVSVLFIRSAKLLGFTVCPADICSGALALSCSTSRSYHNHSSTVLDPNDYTLVLVLLRKRRPAFCQGTTSRHIRL